MSVRYLTMLSALGLVLSAQAYAGCPCQSGTSYYSAGTYYSPSYPSSQPRVATATPPSAPMAGTTQKNSSIEPAPMPPSAPVTGNTYRSYSVQPATTYYYPPDATYRAPSSRSGIPSDYLVERKLHPGSMPFRIGH